MDNFTTQSLLDTEHDEHTLTISACADKFQVMLDNQDITKSPGLGDAEAERRLERFGKNAITPPPRRPEWVRFLSKFADRFVILLLAAAALSASLAGEGLINLYLAIVLVVVVLITVIFAFLEEGKAAALVDTFSAMLPSRTIVRRQGAEREVSVHDLVLGDIVHLKGGDIVPADLRVLSSKGFKVECSSLTGENEPVALQASTVYNSEDQLPPQEATNLAFSGSLAVEGSCVGLVVRTGDATLLGKIAQSVLKVEAKPTTLQLEIDRLVNFISILAVVMGLVVFAVSVSLGTPPAFAFVNGFVVIIIANVPQGLQLVVTILLNVAAQKLAKNGIFIKSLTTVETLGSASAICTDKTGTLTKNEMTVRHLWVNGEVIRASDLLSRGFVFHDIPNQGSAELTTGMSGYIWSRCPGLGELLDAAVVCNSSQYQDEPSFTACKPVGGKSVATKSTARALKAIGETGDVKIDVEHGDVPLHNIAESNLGYFFSSRRLLTPNQRRASVRDGMGQRQRVTLENNEVALGPVAPPPVTGDATDVGLFRFCDSVKPAFVAREDNRTIFSLPFSSRYKYAATLVSPAGDSDSRVLWIKGAPEIILEFCSKSYSERKHEGNVVEDVDESFRAKFHSTYKLFAGEGERVIGFACLKLDPEKFPPSLDGTYESTEDGTINHIPEFKDFTFLGLISLADPPRDGVAEAVAKIKLAGARVIMVTGDHTLTAEAIARQVGIISEERTRQQVAEEDGVDIDMVANDQVGAIVIHGHELARYTEEQWTDAISHPELVFARTTPQQKLDIVQRCQDAGYVVAVTGDGVNDAPALRQADIGIAMGTVGSAVSRDAADLILVEDDWAAIVPAIYQGRVVFDNLSKSIAYTLTHLWPEVFPAILALVFGFPFFLSSLLVLVIDLGTEMCPSIALAYEPGEAGIMAQPPRDIEKDRLVSRNLLLYAYAQAGTVQFLVAFFCGALVFLQAGIPLNALPFSNQQYWSKQSGPLIVDSRTMAVIPHTQHNITGNSAVDADLLRLGYVAPDFRVFSAQDQLDLVSAVQSAYFIGLVGSQAFHIWVCRTRRESAFKHVMNNSNPLLAFGVVVALLLVVVVVYVPGAQQVFGTNFVPGVHWAFPLAFAGVVWPLMEFRKAAVRKNPDGMVKQWLAW